MCMDVSHEWPGVIGTYVRNIYLLYHCESRGEGREQEGMEWRHSPDDAMTLSCK